MPEINKTENKTKVLSTCSACIYILIKAKVGKIYAKRKISIFLITKLIFFLSGFIFSNILSNIDLKNDANRAVSIIMIIVVAFSLFSISNSVSSILIGFVKWFKK